MGEIQPKFKARITSKSDELITNDKDSLSKTIESDGIISKDEFNHLTGGNLELKYFEKSGGYILVTTFDNPNLMEENPSDDNYEWFQIFDQNDMPIVIENRKVIMYRKQCHKGNRIKVENPGKITELFHRGTVVFIVDKDFNLLVPIRSMTKDLYKGQGDVSTGEHVKHGEPYDLAAVRGVEEERKRNIDISDTIYIRKEPIFSKEQTEMVSFYIYVTDDLEFEYGSETQEHRIVNIKELTDNKSLFEELNFRDDFEPIIPGMLQAITQRIQDQKQ